MRRMRKHDPLRAALVAAIAVATLSAANAAETTRERRGHALLATLCADCHAIGRAGGSRHPQAPAFRDLGERYPVEDLQESLAEGLISGHPDMPEFRFSAADTAAVIAYLRSIQKK